MDRFGDIDRLRAAREEDIREVEGFGPKLAAELHAFLHRPAADAATDMERTEPVEGSEEPPLAD
jgi:excinuclease ABC subunit C